MGIFAMKKSLPNSGFHSTKLFTLPYEAVKWELLKTAVELNVFDHLLDLVTADEVASVMSTHSANTEHFLNALVAIGCLTKKDGRFKNTALAELFLTSDKDTSIGNSLLFMNQWNTPVLNGGMLNLIKNGPAPIQNIANESIWEDGARVSVNHTRAGRAQKIASYVSALQEFSSFTKILDLGAGPGVIGIAVAAAHPSLKCYLFDQPAVAKVADEVIAEYGMEDRVQTLCGDYMNDPIGEGYDFIMANFTLNFYRDRLDDLMIKIYQALKPGGIFMVTSDGLTNEKTLPSATVISWLSTSLQGMDMSFEQGKISDAMFQAGFVSVRSRTVDDMQMEAHGPFDLDIARKQK